MPWFVAVALAGAPAPEILDDLDRWHEGADRLIDGPAGCWIFEGEARQVFALHQAPDRFSTADTRKLEAHGPFLARLEDGLWTQFDYRRIEVDEDADLAVALRPLVGRTKESEASSEELQISLGDGMQVSGGVEAGMSLLREAVERWTGSVETRFASWDEAAGSVKYVREVAVADGARSDVVTVTSWFPEAGTEADRIDAVWPKQVKLGKWPMRFTLRDPQMHVQGFRHEGRVLPNAESVSVVVGIMGFTVGYEQQIRYLTATPCTAP